MPRALAWVFIMWVIHPASRISLIYDYNTAISRTGVLLALPTLADRATKEKRATALLGMIAAMYSSSYIWSSSTTASPINKRTIFWQVNFTKLLTLGYRREKIFNMRWWRDYVIAVLNVCKGTVNPCLCVETLWFKHTKRLGSACFLGIRSDTILVLFSGLLSDSMSHCCNLFLILTRHNK